MSLYDDDTGLQHLGWPACECCGCAFPAEYFSVDHYGVCTGCAREVQAEMDAEQAADDEYVANRDADAAVVPSRWEA